MVILPTGASVGPRSHNLGIGLDTYHTPRLGPFRALNFTSRGWFGGSCLYCTLNSTLETTFNLGIGESFTPVTKLISEPGQTKEPGRNTTYLL